MKYTVLHLSHKMPMWTGIADYRIEVESSLLVSSAYFGQVALHYAANGEPPQPTLSEFTGLRRTDAWKKIAL